MSACLAIASELFVETKAHIVLFLSYTVSTLVSDACLSTVEPASKELRTWSVLLHLLLSPEPVSSDIGRDMAIRGPHCRVSWHAWQTSRGYGGTHKKLITYIGS